MNGLSKFKISVGLIPNVFWITKINEKIIVVAPTTAVPISTGFDVALNVLPAPSFASRYFLATSKLGLKPNSFSTSSDTFGTSSIKESSYTDCALSVTGPYESTAIVTGPIPKKPNATKPNANTDEYDIISAGMYVLAKYAIAIKNTITAPIQKPEKLPATKPERIVNEAPPSLDAVTTSSVCFALGLVNIFVASGINAAPKVPQEMMIARINHKLPNPSTLANI